MNSNHFNPLYRSQTWQMLYPVRKYSCQGDAYWAFRISDGEHRYLAHAWEGEFHGPTNLEHGQRVHITGRWTNHQGQPLLRCRTLAPTEAEPLALRKARTRVRALLLKLPESPLKVFVRELFSEPAMLQPFLSLPASRHHHHAYAGGLFIHSVDCAWRVYRNPELAGKEKWIAVVAALLHDLGKMLTFHPDGTPTGMGRYVDHQALTLSVIDRALQHLDRCDEAAGHLLRHYLTWDPRRHPIPRNIGAAWVRLADQASVAAELGRSTAFR